MISEHCSEFQVLQLATLLSRGFLEEIPRFALNIDRVTNSRCAVDSAICCVQSYVRSFLFTQRGSFTDNEISMLLSPVDVAYSLCDDSAYEPWNHVLPEGYDAVVRDLKKAYDVVVVRRKDARDTSERWFDVTIVEYFVVGEYSGQQGVRFSKVVEVGEVEYLPESMPAPQVPSTRCSAKGPAKGKR